MTPNDKGPRTWVAQLMLQALLGVLVLDYAWMSDDAYITLRTVDQFTSGNGLVWNPEQRVQAFTHPLWMFLLSCVYTVTREAFFTTLCVSWVVSAIAIGATPAAIGRRDLGALPPLLLLCVSQSFVHYSTSGLENPLSHVLLVVFLIRSRRATLAELVMWCALACLNRLDTGLIFGPLLLARSVAMIRAQGRAGLRTVLKAVLLGGLPLWLWEGFSLLYFGSLIPNTALAKLGHGYARSEVVMQGVFYLLDAALADPATLVCIVIGVIAAFAGRRRDDVLVAIGLVLYVAYVVWVGGDFMRGRFLSTPVLGAAILLGRAGINSPLSAGVTAAVAMATTLSAKHAPLMVHKDDHGDRTISEWGIADERAYYASKTGLYANDMHMGGPKHGWRWAGETLDGTPRRGDVRAVTVKSNVGLRGYYASHDAVIVDSMGLADPLLSRIPARRVVDWRIGHFSRGLPDGYTQSLRSGENRLEDPVLAALWDDLRLVSTAPLLDGDRLAAIWRLNTGHHAVDHDAAFYFRAKEVVLPAAEPATTTTFRGEGISLVWSEPEAASTLTLALSRGTYDVCIGAGEDGPCERVVSAADGAKPKEKGKRVPKVPLERIEVDLDGAPLETVRVLPVRGPHPFAVEAVTWK